MRKLNRALVAGALTVPMAIGAAGTAAAQTDEGDSPLDVFGSEDTERQQQPDSTGQTRGQGSFEDDDSSDDLLGFGDLFEDLLGDSEDSNDTNGSDDGDTFGLF